MADHTPETGISLSYFGWNSEAGIRLEDWLRVMCRGCARDNGREESGSDMGGMSCDLPAAAYCEPYTPVEDWSADASPRPDRLAELGDGPWPVCMAWQRAPVPAPEGMDPLFETEGTG